MDRSLGDWSYEQGFCFSDVDESNYHMESGWQADFYFGHGKDVIEENAMNEKSCIQALKKLIRKADDDIDELEKDLVLLQCNLAWTESKKKFEVCRNTLRQKIDILDGSMKSLRKGDTINMDDQLQLHRKPAEKLYEVLKPLLGEGCQQDNRQSVDHVYGTSSISSIKVKSEEMEDNNSSLPAADTITNGSFLKHKENGRIPDTEEKPEISIGRVCSHVLINANGCLKLENLGKSVSKIKVEEAKEQCIDAMDMSRKLNPSSVLDGECSLPKALKHGKSVAEEVNPDVSRQSDGFTGNKRSFDPNSSFLVQLKSGNSIVEEKLIEFLLRNKKNKSNQEPIVSESNRSDSSCLSSNTKGKVDNDLEVLKNKEPGPFNTRNVPIILLSKLRDRQIKDTTRTQTKELDRLLLEDSQDVDNVSHDYKSHLNMGPVIEKVQSKLRTSFSKAKKHRKPETIGDNACLDQPFEPKLLVKSVEPCQLRAKMQDDALDADKNLGSLFENEGTSKKLVSPEVKNLSIVADISSSYRIKPNRGTKKEARVVESCSTSDDYSTETLAHLRSTILKLKDLTLVDLRTLAKHLKLTKYHKLRKRVLLELLVSQMDSC